MKFISFLFLALTSAFAQPVPFATVAPASATVNYDKAVDTLVSLPLLTITAGSNSYAYSVNVPVEYTNVVLFSPMVGLLPPGSSNSVQIAVNAQSLNVGTYNIPVNFIQISPNSPNWSVGFSLTLNVTDSRTYVLPSANDRQIPHIAAGGVWRTKVRLVNTTSSTSISEIRLYNAQGLAENFAVNGVLTSYLPGVAVPAKGYVELTLDNPSGLKVGTAMIKPLLGATPGVNVSYANNSPVFESAVEVKTPNRSSITVLFNNTGRNSTGIAISNALNFEQELTFEFLDEQGVSMTPTWLAVAKVRVPQNGQYIATVNSAWPFTAGRAGSIRITGTQPALFGFGLQFDLDSGVFYTQPAF